MPELQRAEKTRPFLFELEPYFQAETLDLREQDYVPITGEKMKEHPVLRHHPYPNPYIENELKGYCRHLFVDLHLAAPTLNAYFTLLFHHMSKFLADCHPDLRSIIELDYEVLEKEHDRYLQEHDLTSVCRSTQKRYDRQLNPREYNYMNDYYYMLRNYYRYIYMLCIGSHEPEYDKPVWDVRRLGIRCNVAPSRPRWTVSFRKISQPWLVDAAKKYQYYRIPVMTMSAVLDDIKGLNLFSEFLREEHPEMQSLTELNRGIIEDYMTFIHTRGFVTTTANRRLSVLKTFLRIGNYLELPGFPEKPLILQTDFSKKVLHMPKYFTDSELKRMNEHIGELPKQISRMLFVLENCGMRVSDLCETKIMPEGKYCLSTSNEGKYIFTYYMPKVKKHNTIPVSNIVGLVLEDAIAESRENFGDNCEYIFAKSETAPIATETFNIHMNNMTYKNQLRLDDGSPMYIAGHTFRGTVATRYANMGISLEMIRSMLGQAKISVLRHYITIHSATMIEYMRPIIEEANDRILKIGSPESPAVRKESRPCSNLISLPNGWCGKSRESGICSHANACYACRMFHPSPEHLPVYRMQLAEAENNILVAELNGYTRLLEQNRSLKNNLENIIKNLEENNA